MGANQSSGSGGAGQSSADQAAEIKTGYYELLNVERQATDDEIKKAYRRKALELHPDRNYGDVERATKLFAEVQTAYQVLSDPQERAWYDSHENAILRGDDADIGGDGDPAKYEHSVGVTSADDITRLLRRFNGNVKYTDAPSGFFGFLRETFETLAKEEEVAASREGVDVPEYPPFGHKDDEYDDVVKSFYAAWNGFATHKTFAWRDRYRTSDADDRRMRRQMEKENKRFRDDGVREFNEAVRLLVAFVRKRDPRFTPNSQTEAERQDMLRKVAERQAQAARAANAKMTEDVVPDWTKTREPEEVDEEIDEESEEEQFECVACRKTFKSENQYEAHERSKKHLKAVQALRRKLQREGHDLDLDDEEDSTGVNTPAQNEEEVGHEHAAGEEVIENTGAQKKQDQVQHEKDLPKDFKTLKVEEIVQNNDTGEYPEQGDATAQRTRSSSTSSYSSSKSLPHPDDLTHPSKPSQATNEDSDDQDNTPKLGKAAQKRAKKAAQQAAAIQDGQNHKCATCNSTFSSKTRLFQHIKDHGHAAPVTAAGKAGKGKKKR